MNKAIVSLLLTALITGISWSQTKIACIGNSITAGSGADTSYPVRLAKLLGSSYSVQNDGVSGKTLLKHGDHPYWTEGKLAQVFTLKPAIITIKLGTNDTKPQNWDSYNKEFKTDYLAMLDTLNTISSKPKIWMVLPVPIFANTMSIRDSALKKIIVILKQIATERNLPVIDVNTPLLSFSKYFPDGVHPDDPGADTIAHVFYRALTSTTEIAPGSDTKRIHLNPIVSIRGKNGVLTMTVPFSGSSSVELFDCKGRLISTTSFQSSGTFPLALKGMITGMFVARIINGGKAYFAKGMITR